MRVFIVDDHAILRGGLRMLIEADGMVVVGEAATGEKALADVASTNPDIVILDLDLGGESGLDYLTRLLEAASGARVVVLTGIQDTELHRNAVKLGAMGLVMKEEAGAVLIQAIKCVHRGEAWLNRAMTASVLTEMTRRDAERELEAARIASLTDRERQVIALVGEGFKNRQVGERLFISEATVRNHLTSILGKLGLSDRFELALYAYKNKLARPPL